MNKLYEKYLMVDKASRKEALAKVIKVLQSTNNKEQVKVAANMIWGFHKMYGQTFTDDIKDMIGRGDIAQGGLPSIGMNSQENRFMDMIINKLDKIEHIKRMAGK